MIMEQLIKDEQLVGKTIARVAYIDNTYALFFTDDTYVIFRGCGWEEHDVQIMSEEYSLVPKTIWQAWDLKGLGVITEEEYVKFSSEAEKRDIKAKIQREKDLLMELKAKYESEN